MNSAILATTILFAAPPPKDAPKVQPAIVGVWRIVSAVKGGAPGAAPLDAAMEFTTDGSVIFVEGGKNAPGEMTYKVDLQKDPPHLDLTSPAIKGGQPRVQVGIFKIEKNTLTICLTFVAERPSRFESPKGSGIILLTLERIAKE